MTRPSDKRRRLATFFHLQGLTPADIAAKVGTPTATAEADVDAVMKEWRAELDRVRADPDCYRVLELAKLDAVEGLLWNAWEQRPTDPAILRGIVEVIAERRQLLGLHEPTKPDAEVRKG